MRFVSSFVVIILYLSLSQASTNLCEEASGCRCVYERDTWSISVRCSGNIESLNNITLENITEIIISASNITHATSLDLLRKFTSMKTLKFRRTEIAHFDWNWLPDSCEDLLISYPTSRLHKALTKYPTFNQNCTLRSTLKLDTLYLGWLPYEDVPSCWPSSLSRISFVGIPLTKLQSRNETLSPVIWPSNVTFIYLKAFDFTYVASRVFQNAPPSLNKIYINECNKPVYNFFSIWPESGNILSLYVRNCFINSTQASDFQYLQQLQLLDLYGNNFMSVPADLPSTLRTLLLGKNSIEYIERFAWTNLNNLTKLNLGNNKLRNVPLNLPKTLENLILNDNLIEFSSSEAFSHLKQLKSLIMTRNKLISMPPPLTSNLLHLDISRNAISLVRSSKSYDYCLNCSMNLYGNPWICDENMIRMIVWASRNKVGLVLDKKCDQTNPNVLETVNLNEIAEYFGYIRTSRMFRRCVYSINDLRCVNASLSQLPLNPPSVLINATFTHNSNLTTIPENHFIEQIKLIRLNLSYNSITEFPKGLPSSIKRLWLEGNQIQSVTRDVQPTLEMLINLEELHLEDNQIQVMYDYQLLVMPKLMWVGLQYNPLHCNCPLSSLTNWYEDHPHQDGHLNLPRCDSPASYHDRPITQLAGYYRYALRCTPVLCESRETPGVINCSRSTQKTRENSTFTNEDFDPTVQPRIPKNSYWQTLDLSYLELQEDDINLRQLTQLQTLHMTGNRLSVIPLKNLPSTVENLILAHNFIQHIAPNIVQRLPHIKFLDLRYNKIQLLSNPVLSNLPVIERVFLQGNPFQCNCDLSPFVNYLQAQKKNNQTLIDNNFQFLTCANPKELRNLTLINLSKETYCTTATWTNVTVGVVVSVSTLLLISLITIILLYKRRKRQKRKDILEGFRKLLENEAFQNEDKRTDEELNLQYKYDAFVSYCNNANDEDFVYQMLEALEDERGKKLCIHERDFTTGQGISDNIVNCIQSSRRIILIISMKYTESAWCQYQVQIALAQMHQQRRGKLLIPILLEDVTKNPDRGGSVKTILSLINGIDVPSNHSKQQSWEDFWNKLELLISEQPPQKNVQLAYEVD